MWASKLKAMPRVHGVHVAPDGRVLAVGGPDAGWFTAAAWVAPGAVPRTLPVNGSAYAVAPDFGELLAAATGSQRIDCRLDLRTGKLRSLPPPALGPDRVQFLAAAFAPDGRTVAVLDHHQPDRGPFRNTLVVRAADTWAGRSPLADLGHAYGGLTWHPAGDRVAVFAGREYGGGMRQFAADLTADTALPLGDQTVRVAAYSPCGGWLVAVFGRAALALSTDGRWVIKLQANTKSLLALAFAPDGRLLTAGTDGVVRTWDIDAGREVASFDPGVGPLHALAVAPDGLTAVAAGKNVVVGWDT